MDVSGSIIMVCTFDAVLFLRQVTGNTPLMYAAMENKINTVERMIELG
jgi:ankyrin repeat protein